MSLQEIGKRAKEAESVLRNLHSKEKDDLLQRIANELLTSTDLILAANQKDIEAAKDAGISESLLDRLLLTKERIQGIAEGVLAVLQLKDPIGSIDSMWERPNGLLIGKKRVPLGVIAIIYEARPNVTVDAAVLCLKTSNAVILRGGKEAIHSNIALTTVMQNALKSLGLPEYCVQIIEDTDRSTATGLMKLSEYVDVLIPRGGAGLIRSVVENATVPVIETGTGNCHVYIDASADFQMGTDIIVNAKTSRPSVCNAAETLLVHESIANDFLPDCIAALRKKGVRIRGCEKTRAVIRDAEIATEEDWCTEYGDFILAVKVVNDLRDAISHINRYNTGHSEAIVTKDYMSAQTFLQEVDAAAVYVNASTRFTDGNEFGFGAEIGISTQKMHARGPMGLNELTTIKYIIYGNGQIRE